MAESNHEGVGSGPEESKVEVATGNLFMLLGYQSEPVSSRLYKIKVNHKLLSSETVGECGSITEPIDRIKPIHAFPSSDYPENMACVKFKSKLYFLGGRLKSPDQKCPEDQKCPVDVYVIDTSKIVAGHKCEILKNHAPPMNVGKPQPYAFQACDGIYVIDSSGEKKMPLFEFFQPEFRCWNRPGIRPCWKPLPDPPKNSWVLGHAVVGKRVFLSCHGRTESGHVLCFDLEKSVWIQNFIQGFPRSHLFCGQAQLLGGTLYCLSSFSSGFPAAYKFTKEIVEENVSNCPVFYDRLATNLFDNQALACPSKLSLCSGVSTMGLSSKLVYLGNQNFCYVNCGSFPSLDSSEYGGLILEFFRPLPGTVTEKHTCFRPCCFAGEILHSNHFKIEPADTDYGNFDTIKGCFFFPKQSEGFKTKTDLLRRTT